jgi:hypothetical protein
MKLKGTIHKVSALSEREHARMFALMTSHYENVNQEKFLRDLAEKDGVLLLSDETGEIQGFTTFLLLEFAVCRQPAYALYSGDTIINKTCWGQMELFRVFGGLFKTFLVDRKEPLYWFLLTKGIRTYLLLPLFFKEFYPNFSTETPVHHQHLITQLATLRFGEFYLKEQGIVRVLPRADRLQESLACIPEHRSQNPHVRFFTEKNPGYTEGDELVCLAQISASNFTRVATQFVRL